MFKQGDDNKNYPTPCQLAVENKDKYRVLNRKVPLPFVIVVTKYCYTEQTKDGKIDNHINFSVILLLHKHFIFLR